MLSSLMKGPEGAFFYLQFLNVIYWQLENWVHVALFNKLIVFLIKKVLERYYYCTSIKVINLLGKRNKILFGKNINISSYFKLFSLSF